jgi:hypothetical protein
MPEMMVRVQLDLPENRVRELEKLMREVGVTTKKEFFNYALSLFRWAIKEMQDGRVIASVDTTTEQYKEMVMPLTINVK